MSNDLKLNIFVIENNYDHVVYAKNNFKESEEKLEVNFLGEIFPKEKSISEKIHSYAQKIHDGIHGIEALFEYVDNYINENKIDVILLDFLLNEGEEEEEVARKPHDTTGGKLLVKLKEKYPDLPIVSYTKISNRVDEAPLIGKDILFHLDKNFTWDFFNKNLALLFKIMKEGEKFLQIREHTCDIAVVCALQSELNAVLKLSLDWKKFEINKKTYFSGKLNNYKIVASSEDRMGMPEAAALTTRMIDIFHPKFVVMTGIAGGIGPADQVLLDLLIPDRVSNWQAGKYKTKKENEWSDKNFHIFERDYRQEETYFKDITIITANKDDFITQILEQLDFNGFKYSKPKVLNIFTEGMVSGSAVVADKDIVNEKVDGRKIYGVDMEAYGMAFACNNHPSEPKPKPIIIKSITDFADEEKSDDAQPAGKHVSAIAFKVLFESFMGDKE
jgi:nucleoside phosphorylase